MKNNRNNKNKVNKQAKNKKSQNTIFISGCKTQGSNLDHLVKERLSTPPQYSTLGWTFMGKKDEKTNTVIADNESVEQLRSFSMENRL
ncbi:hypothetical protein B5F08_12140 [Anaeromassilibacillus sp. An172]|uniref:hypothetical protein n=1 Tax=Anaeromassilibacillus sp. An172 TaxID=1965570 RepID=UPI000B36F91E|nr:hypothetical protein [Anaeromassilibacillus sp. An172]OUP74380.1 hypothetical protein B5F08_12140 [Anaeromassilibacillus sp. An172]